MGLAFRQPEAPSVLPQLQIEALVERWKNCRRCDRAKSRTCMVMPMGSPRAPIMIVGSSPSKLEDRWGHPLVGEGGDYCMSILAGLGINPARDVYATLACKCRGGFVQEEDGSWTTAKPKVEEAEDCLTMLEAEIELVKPAIIVLQGKFASQLVLGDGRPFNQFVGHIRQYGKRCVAVSVRSPYGLTFGDGWQHRPEYAGHWEEIAIRLDVLGRMWRPDADIFASGWTYQNRGQVSSQGAVE